MSENNRPDSIMTPGTSVLIVDDSSEYAKVLSKILVSGLGYTEVTTVSSIEEAYAQIQANPDSFDLLFVDFHFPGGATGKDLVERLQKEGILDSKVAFLITAEPDVEKAKIAAQNGLAGVVVKPFDRGQLKGQIERAERDLHMAKLSEE